MGERRDVPRGTLACFRPPAPRTPEDQDRFYRELVRLVVIASERRAKMALVEQRGTEVEHR